MNLPLTIPDEFFEKIKQKLNSRGFNTPEEYILHLIRRDVSYEDGVKQLAQHIAYELRGTQTASASGGEESGVRCMWKNIVPFEMKCSSLGNNKIQYVFLGEGLVTADDWKTGYVCDQHLELLKQHDSFEVEDGQ